MSDEDIEVYVECYVEQGYDPGVAEAFVRADREPPPLWRILSVGFTAAEDNEVLEPHRKRREKSNPDWGKA